MMPSVSAFHFSTLAVEALTAPAPLNGDGQPLPAGADPVFLRYCGYDLKPYSDIKW